MKCSKCGSDQLKVIDTRSVDDQTIKRRRECESCGYRFSTYEREVSVPVLVIKKDQSREPFNSDKIRNGIIRSAYKRPISTETIDNIVDGIDAEVRRMGMKEVPTSVIGGLLMEALKNLDAISYIRYASVYLRLEDAEELGKLLKDVTQVTKVTKVTKGKSL